MIDQPESAGGWSDTGTHRRACGDRRRRVGRGPIWMSGSLSGFRHCARRQEPGLGGGGPKHQHRLRHQQRPQHDDGDRRVHAHGHRHRGGRLPPWWGGGGPGTHTVYVANFGSDTVSVIDGSTYAVIATVPVGKTPDGVAVDPGTHTVYVANRRRQHGVGDRRVDKRSPPPWTSADTRSGWRWTRVPTPSTSPTGDAMVSEIDGSTHTVTANVHLGNTPAGVAVDPDTHTVYVANYGHPKVSVIDGEAHTVTATVARPQQPVRGSGGSGHPHRLRHQLRRRQGVGDRRDYAHRHRHRGRRRKPRAVAVNPDTHLAYVSNTKTARSR